MNNNLEVWVQNSSEKLDPIDCGTITCSLADLWKLFEICSELQPMEIQL